MRYGHGTAFDRAQEGGRGGGGGGGKRRRATWRRGRRLFWGSMMEVGWLSRLLRSESTLSRSPTGPSPSRGGSYAASGAGPSPRLRHRQPPRIRDLACAKTPPPESTSLDIGRETDETAASGSCLDFAAVAVPNGLVSGRRKQAIVVCEPPPPPPPGNNPPPFPGRQFAMPQSPCSLLRSLRQDLERRRVGSGGG